MTTELEALRRVAEAARKWQKFYCAVKPDEGDYLSARVNLLTAIHALDALPTPQPTPARSRLAALEALHAVVRDYDRGTGQDVRWADVRAALAAVDDSPAPAAEPEGEAVEVVAAVGWHPSTRLWSVRGWSNEPLSDSQDVLSQCRTPVIATIRARVPLPRVPEVVGEVG